MTKQYVAVAARDHDGRRGPLVPARRPRPVPRRRRGAPPPRTRRSAGDRRWRRRSRHSHARWSPRRPTRPVRSACAPAWRCAPRHGAARRRSSCRRTSRRTRRRRIEVMDDAATLPGRRRGLGMGRSGASVSTPTIPKPWRRRSSGRCSTRPASTARSASATTSCGPRPPRPSPSRPGVYRLTAENWLDVMGWRPTQALWGIGAKTARKLSLLGIDTVQPARHGRRRRPPRPLRPDDGTVVRDARARSRQHRRSPTNRGCAAASAIRRRSPAISSIAATSRPSCVRWPTG